MKNGNNIALGEPQSLLLDVIRFAAAVAVAYAHITQPFFADNIPNLIVIGTMAVGVFFVLSGFVMRYITLQRRLSGREYIIDRVSRIYSVALPVLLFTIGCDWISAHVNPQYYFAHWGSSTTHAVARIPLNLLMLSEPWGTSFSPLSNSPFWSLTYECTYYAMFGFWLFLRGSIRWVAIFATALLTGPWILFCFPLWLLGCVTFDVYAKRTRGKKALIQLAFCSGTALVWPLFCRLAKRNDLTGRGQTLMQLAGIATALLMLYLLTKLDGTTVHLTEQSVKRIRQIASATFALYLIHFPLYVLIGAGFPYNHSNKLALLAIPLLPIGLSILIAGRLDNLKSSMRRYMRRLWPERMRQAALSTSV